MLNTSTGMKGRDMKIIYHCFGGAHSSVTVAAIHMGWLNKAKLPSSEDLMDLPYYDKTTDDDFGTIHYMGTDEMGNDVYVLGKKSLGDRFSRLMMGVAEILYKEDQLLAVNVMKHVNLWMKLGGFTSRRLNFTFIGRPVVIWGTRKAYDSMVKLVEVTRLRVLSNKQG